jgi:hypothetical protein
MRSMPKPLGWLERGGYASQVSGLVDKKCHWCFIVSSHYFLCCSWAGEGRNNGMGINRLDGTVGRAYGINVLLRVSLSLRIIYRSSLSFTSSLSSTSPSLGNASCHFIGCWATAPAGVSHLRRCRPLTLRRQPRLPLTPRTTPHAPATPQKSTLSHP